MHNTLKLVEQIVYMLIVGGLQGSGVDFSEENQEFYWLYCTCVINEVALFIVSLIAFDFGFEI